jgi:hypothetical protein
MRYFAQQMQQNRMMRRSMQDAQPGAVSGKGGGGGGFGQLIHSIFGGGARLAWRHGGWTDGTRRRQQGRSAFRAVQDMRKNRVDLKG